MHSTRRRVARDAADAAPARDPPVGLSPGRASTCCPAPPAYSARPSQQAGDETNTDAPSRHRQRSIYAEAACHWSATCPTPTGAASDTLCGRWARQLWLGGPCPWSMLWANTGACRPGYGPRPTRSQVDGDLTVVDLAQAAAPLARHTHRLGSRLGKARGVENQ